MGQKHAVAEVVRILKDVEEQLSDGYIFYCEEEVDDRLKEIAERIVNSIHLLLF